MISQNFPIWDKSPSGARRREDRSVRCVRTGAFPKAPVCVQSEWCGYDWLRGSLLLSGTGSPRDRRRWKCADGGDRGADRRIRPVFGTARTAGLGAVWDQRDAQDRWRGPRGVEREPQASCRDQRRRGVRRSRPQISDLGAWPFPKGARGGHRKDASAQGAAGFPGGGAKRARSTGMMAGGGGSAVAGGPALHIPVLGGPAIDFLNVSDGGVYIDGTFGAGGYTRAILEAA